MVKATSPYPYIALTLIKYEDVAFGMDIEARYEPIAESNALWDIRDVQQVCLVYKGVWKSEMEDWKKGCRTLTEVDWSKIALGINAWGSDKSASPATSATATSAARAAGAAASTNNIVTTAAASAPSVATSSAIYSAEDRFLNYRARTKHLRHRTCPNCESCGCTLSRVPEGAHGCECGECYGSDAEDDGEEYYKYGHEEAGNASLSTSSSSTSSSTSTTSTSSSSASAVSASTATTSTSSASGKSRPSSTAEKETVASVLVRGHRARVVQCIYLEAF